MESSSQRFHAYWLVNDLPLAEFSAAQLMLAERFNGDPSVKDLPRVMRLPGFMHRKQEPYLTKILEVNSSSSYHRSDFIDAFGFDPNITAFRDKVAILEGTRNTTLFSMALGFVKKGLNVPEIVRRLHKINDKRCVPPLPDHELQDIASRVHGYGTSGTLNVAYRHLDSAFKELSFGAAKLDITVRRITNGNPEVPFSLLPDEMAKWGFGNPKTLRRYRDELIDSGLMTIHRRSHYGQNGAARECGLYRILCP